ncbi:MAG: hypothetical protein JSW67_12245 [Candidatus Latescibacterota bacterium]|nr:MAG: hypothetical protein JSW67_12245 [Candidatus Latescibacterota bacterium]
MCKRPRGDRSSLVLLLGLLACFAGCTQTNELQMQPRSRLRFTVAIDGDTLSSLSESVTTVCLRAAGPLLLQFRRTYDPQPQIADDEIFLLLEIRVASPHTWPLGESVEIATTDSIRVQLGVSCFCPQPLEALTQATGTLRLDSIAEFGAWGSAELVFTDPEDLNSVVQDSVALSLDFEALPFSPGCQPPP